MRAGARRVRSHHAALLPRETTWAAQIAARGAAAEQPRRIGGADLVEVVGLVEQHVRELVREGVGGGHARDAGPRDHDRSCEGPGIAREERLAEAFRAVESGDEEDVDRARIGVRERPDQGPLLGGRRDGMHQKFNGFTTSAKRVRVTIRSSDYSFNSEDCGRWEPAG